LQPFIPKIIGTGKVAQFQTFASFQIGFYLALIAAALVTASHFISIIRFRREATEQETRRSRFSDAGIASDRSR
jgi:hypothetical protein